SGASDRTEAISPARSASFGDTSNRAAGRDTETRAFLRMSRPSYLLLEAAEVPELPKESGISERSVGWGAEESAEAITRCMPEIVCGDTWAWCRLPPAAAS